MPADAISAAPASSVDRRAFRSSRPSRRSRSRQPRRLWLVRPIRSPMPRWAVGPSAEPDSVPAVHDELLRHGEHVEREPIDIERRRPLIFEAHERDDRGRHDRHDLLRLRLLRILRGRAAVAHREVHRGDVQQQHQVVHRREARDHQRRMPALEAVEDRLPDPEERLVELIEPGVDRVVQREQDGERDQRRQAARQRIDLVLFVQRHRRGVERLRILLELRLQLFDQRLELLHLGHRAELHVRKRPDEDTNDQRDDDQAQAVGRDHRVDRREEVAHALDQRVEDRRREVGEEHGRQEAFREGTGS